MSKHLEFVLPHIQTELVPFKAPSSVSINPEKFAQIGFVKYTHLEVLADRFVIN